MAIIPTVRCRSMRAALAFYTGVLDFERVDGDETLDDPSFSVVARDGDRLFLSSHRGDGAFGQAVVVTTDDIDSLFRKYRERGLATPGNPDAPQAAHEGPIDQSWGTREFYVDDPDGIRCGSPRGSQPGADACDRDRDLRNRAKTVLTLQPPQVPVIAPVLGIAERAP